MKIKIIVDEDLEESEIIIKTPKICEETLEIQKKLLELESSKEILAFDEDKEVYLTLDNILYFESSNRVLFAHTKTEYFVVKKRLYELEEILPKYFIRVSKSTILNLDAVYSINYNVTSSSVVEFRRCVKKVYVSRKYYKLLKDSLTDRRLKR